MYRPSSARTGLTAASLFLGCSATLHLLNPELAQEILQQPSWIRVLGVILTGLGLLILPSARLVVKVAGLLVLASGLSRAIVPEHMIAINSWTTKATHGVLMAVGAVLLYMLSRKE